MKSNQLAAGLVLAGIAVEAGTLVWSHPISFIVFFIAGGLFMGAGILVYLKQLIWA